MPKTLIGFTATTLSDRFLSYMNERAFQERGQTKLQWNMLYFGCMAESLTTNTAKNEDAMRRVAHAANLIKSDLRVTVETLRPYSRQKGQKAPPPHPTSSVEAIAELEAALKDIHTTLTFLNQMLQDVLPKLLQSNAS